MSSFVKTWKVGDQIEWRGPFGNFYYRPNQVSTCIQQQLQYMYMCITLYIFIIIIS